MTDTRLGIAIADEAGIHDAPTVVTWTEIFKLIDVAREYERKQCVKACEDERIGTGKHDHETDRAYDRALDDVAKAIRMRSNAALTGAEGVRVEGTVMRGRDEH